MDGERILVGIAVSELFFYFGRRTASEWERLLFKTYGFENLSIGKNLDFVVELYI